MNSRDLVCRTLLGSEELRYPCGPLATFYTARLAGVSIQEYTMDPQVLANCVIDYYEKFQPDAVWVSADTWITAEAMGAKVHFIDEIQPMCGIGEPLIKTVSDIEKIPPVMPDIQGRMPLMRAAVEKVKKSIGDDAFLVACFDQSPFSLACHLMGINNLMTKLFDDPPFIEALLHKCCEYCSAYGIYLAEAGPDMLSTGDSAAGLIGKVMYQEIALPSEKEVFDTIKELSHIFLSLHICGKTSHILTDMASSGCNVLEVDYETEIEDAMCQVNGNIGLWGNIDPVGVLYDACPEAVYQRSIEILEKVHRFGRRRFVLSSGCTLVPETPKENMQIFIQAVKEKCVSKL